MRICLYTYIAIADAHSQLCLSVACGKPECIRSHEFMPHPSISHNNYVIIELHRDRDRDRDRDMLMLQTVHRRAPLVGGVQSHAIAVSSPARGCGDRVGDRA